MRIPVDRTIEPHARECISRPLASLLSWGTTHPQAELDVLSRCHPGEERVFLKNNTTVRTGLAYFSATKADATLRGPDEAGNEVEQRRLSATGRPDETDKLTITDAQ